MSRCCEHHIKLTNGIGKCSVPMWQMGMPAGFCDRDAYGNRPEGKTIRRWDGFEYRDDGLYSGYVPYLACPCHGGPKDPIILYELDGNAWCAHYSDFTNLMESPCGFGSTKEEAKEELAKRLLSALENKR